MLVNLNWILKLHKMTVFKEKQKKTYKLITYEKREASI